MNRAQWLWALPVLAGALILVGSKSQEMARKYGQDTRDGLALSGALLLVVWVFAGIAVSVVGDIAGVFDRLVGLALSMIAYQILAAILIFFPLTVVRLFMKRPSGPPVRGRPLERLEVRSLGHGQFLGTDAAPIAALPRPPG